MNKILNAQWFGMDIWLILLLLFAGVGIAWFLCGRKKKSCHAASETIPAPHTSFPTMEELQAQRAILERKKHELLHQHRLCAETERIAHTKYERLNAIENVFFREFGLVERMSEIQKCLSMESYTGILDVNVLYTNLINMQRMICKLEETQEKTDEAVLKELFVPGWLAMEEIERKLEHSHTDERQTLMNLFHSQMENVENTLDQQLNQVSVAAVYIPDMDKERYWESKLSEVKQLLGLPEAESEEQRIDTARRLAKYAAENFKERL